MKISELKQPYRDLALMRQEQAGNAKHGVDAPLSSEVGAFLWCETSEDEDFWLYVDEGRTPDIPSSSLADLEEWRKAKQEANKPETWGKQLYDSGQFHDLLTKYENAEPDYKAMYERLLKLHEELQNVNQNMILGQLKSTSRNWVAECALRFAPSLGVASWDYAEAWAAEGKKRNHI